VLAGIHHWQAHDGIDPGVGCEIRSTPDLLAPGQRLKAFNATVRPAVWCASLAGKGPAVRRLTVPFAGMALALVKNPSAAERSTIMAAITIDDLPCNLTLDQEAMVSIHGGGAPWVYGWITPYVAAQPSLGPVVNLYEVNNTFNANQMINQFQSVDVNNSGANSNMAVSPNERSANHAG
jgi:hypothetical protein